MKYFRALILSIIFLFTILLGITTKGLSNNNNINNDNNEEKIVYNIINKGVGINGVLNIDTYDKYLDYINDYSRTPEYDKEFFNTNNLILYGSLEPSGSIKVLITSLKLDNENNLILNVLKKSPYLGTCDMSNHGYIIEYQKPQKPINKIILRTTINKIDTKEFILKDENSKTDIVNFLNQINHHYIYISAFIWFNYDDNMTQYKEANEERIIDYQIDQLNGSFTTSEDSPTVLFNFDSFDDNELNKLYTISQYEGVGTVYLTICYDNIIIDEVIEE